jgi:hypothetical protein
MPTILDGSRANQQIISAEDMPYAGQPEAVPPETDPHLQREDLLVALRGLDATVGIGNGATSRPRGGGLGSLSPGQGAGIRSLGQGPAGRGLEEVEAMMEEARAVLELWAQEVAAREDAVVRRERDLREREQVWFLLCPRASGDLALHTKAVHQ